MLLVDDPDVRLYVGHALEVLADLPDQSVHAILTSPPFYGLRNYGHPGQIGLEPTPDEWAAALVQVFAAARRVLRDDGSLWVEVGDSYASDSTYNTTNTLHDEAGWRQDGDHRPNVQARALGLKAKDLILAPALLAFALRADGWVLRGQYVWEKPDCMPESVEDRCTTSHSFVLHLTKGVDATYWTHPERPGSRTRPAPDYRWHGPGGEVSLEPVEGWRRVNLWRARDYYFDLDAIREPFSDYNNIDLRRPHGAGQASIGGRPASGTRQENRKPVIVAADALVLDGFDPVEETRGPDGRREFALVGQHNSEQHRNGSRWPSLEGRSPRSVWRIATEASSFGLCPVCRTYWDARAPARHCGEPVIGHFAIWPHALAGKIIACSTSEGGCCASCGAPTVRAVMRERAPRGDSFGTKNVGEHDHGQAGAPYRAVIAARTTGWLPTCSCVTERASCVVLDPFAGSGTTGRQARAMGRHAILIELNPDYAEIASHRLAQQGIPGL